MPNANWSYSLGPYSFTVDTVSGTGSITFTGGGGSALGASASYTPPNGSLANGSNLGSSGAVTDINYTSTGILSFSYNGFTYASGVKQQSSTQTIFKGTVNLPSTTAVNKNWTATK